MPSNPDSLEIVQLEKQESAALGGDAADEAPYSAPIDPEEDMIEVAGVSLIESGDTRPTRARAIWPDGNDLRFRDPNNPGSGKTLTELAASAGGGITEPQHEALDTQVHALAETRELVITRVAGRVTEILNRTVGGSPLSIRKTEVTRTAGRISQILVRQYDAAGAEITARRMTGTINRTGGKITSIDWVEGP